MSAKKKNFFDVIICGGGPSGVAAALTSARNGAKTLLIERYGFCGGMATAALVNPWAGHEYTEPKSGKQGSLIGGIFKEIVVSLSEKNGYGTPLSPSAFDEELLKYIYDTKLLEAGVHIRYHSYLSSVQMNDEKISSLEVISKGGVERFSANVFIDCSGDGDVAALAGIPFTVGREKDGMTQAMTVSFRMANVDKKEMLETGHLKKARALVEPYFQEALSSGKLHYPYRDFIHFYDYPREGILHFNQTRITKVSGLSAGDLSNAEIEGRRQAFQIGEWLIQNVPYFKNAFIEKIACQVGVRETRHIHGIYTMTKDDIVESTKFDDGITRSRYFIDIHNPTGAKDVHQSEGKKGTVKSSFSPVLGDFYEVPFRSLITSDCSNIIVACRALSATHTAQAAIRVMATMHGLGEAAGIAAAKAINDNKNINEIDGTWVRSQIPYMSEEPDYSDVWTLHKGSMEIAI